MRRTPSTSIRPALFAASLLLTACASSAPAPPTPTAASDAADEIRSMLAASAESWTRGDLDGFLDDYAEDATFVGSSGLVRGRASIREGYVRGYWSTGMPEDGLRFRLLDVRSEGPEAAVAVGRYELFDRETEETTSSGMFSLTLRRTGQGWKIVHDHSSG